MEHPKRKHPRLGAYDYGETGVYFVTVCTQNRERSLCEIVGRGDLTPQLTRLTVSGQQIDTLIRSMDDAYDHLRVLHHVVMPNHIRLLLALTESVGGVGSPRPTIDGAPKRRTALPEIIKGFKAMTRRVCGKSLWQASFHDHIIRDDGDLQNHWVYIDENPTKWENDEYY